MGINSTAGLSRWYNSRLAGGWTGARDRMRARNQNDNGATQDSPTRCGARPGDPGRDGAQYQSEISRIAFRKMVQKRVDGRRFIFRSVGILDHWAFARYEGIGGILQEFLRAAVFADMALVLRAALLHVRVRSVRKSFRIFGCGSNRVAVVGISLVSAKFFAPGLDQRGRAASGDLVAGD